MSQEKIRILVDRSRDSGWADKLANMEPDDIYQATENRGYLGCSLLKNYDVLAICGCSILKYKDEELESIRKFVEAGGGFLLASSSSRFEAYTDKPVSEMHTNELARLFGAEFLSLDKCKGKTKLGDHFIRGYPRDDLRMVPHAALAELELDDIPISNCGIIAIPEDAQVFLEHSKTKEPIGACMNFGRGRILLINDVEFSRESHRVCRAFIDWLAINRVSRIEGDEAIPDEIQVDEHAKEDGKIRIYYTDFVKERVDTCLEFAKRIDKDIIVMFPKGSDKLWNIGLGTSCIHRSSWEDPPIHIGAFMSDARLVYALATEMLNALDPHFETLCIRLMAVKMLGFESEAEKACAEIVKDYKEKYPTGWEYDISKNYGYHTEQVWIRPEWLPALLGFESEADEAYAESMRMLEALMDKHGNDLIPRLAKAVPAEDPWKDMPGHLFSGTDTVIYYFSLALEMDLYPWFEKMGTTVHPLPLHPRDSDEFRDGARKCLNDALRNNDASANDRNNAILDLMDIYDREKKPQSEFVEELASDDKYERLVAAIWLSRSTDNRAVPVLEDIAFDKNDRTLAAIAALALVRRGATSAADRLFEVAKEQDYIFQLDAGYALRKIGDERAGDLPENLEDEDGKPVVDIETEYDGYLRIFPRVREYRVANVFTAFQVQHFPANTHITTAYVDGVYTHSPYRRKGLSRRAMQETFGHKAVRRCSCAYLGTGTRNTAHAMYRSFGFVDIGVDEGFTKELRNEKVKIVEGLSIRSYLLGDEVRMTELANERPSAPLGTGRARARRPRLSNTYIKIAEKDGEMLGYALAWVSRDKESACLSDICLKETNIRKDAGLALLCALHNELASRGYKKINVVTEGAVEPLFLRDLLHSFGYSFQPAGVVGMFKIMNLPMLLEELSSLLIKRLGHSDYKDWYGRIGIVGKQHKAGLSIGNGEISVLEKVSEDMDILISADDDTITKVIAGIMTPFEAYLQTELSIRPIVNSRVTELLETLFPRIPIVWLEAIDDS